MSDAPPAVGGPDLRSEGLLWIDLPDGEMRLGHVGSDPVLVVRRGDAAYAVGAQCTHYSGPLVEGLLVGDTVRCPLHHACFDLRTGAALRAPALSPLPCWAVEHRDGRLFVGAKQERDPLAPVGGARPASPPASVVIIGAGAAGTAAAEMVRRQGYDGPVTVVDGESESPYDRPNLSKDYLTGAAPAEWIPLRPSGFYEAHGIDVKRTRATAIDVGTSVVRLADGTALPFGALLLATGSEAIALPVPGADLPHVHRLRSLEDSTAIIRAAEHARRAVVIGSSFIGLEVTASLRTRGLNVTVVSNEAEPFMRTLGQPLSGVVRALHESHGVRFVMPAEVVRIDDAHVVLRDGTSLDAELVVVGIGVRPRLELAEAAGLRINRGVVVDGCLKTSVSTIWAAGDIARWHDPHEGAAMRVEHWVVAERMGQTAARNMLGRHEVFDAVPFFWTQQYDTTIQYIGHAERWDSVEVAGDLAAGHGAVTYRANGATVAVASIGEHTTSLLAEAALERVVASRC